MKPAVKERRLELAVQVANCGHDDDRGRISDRAGSPVFILPLTTTSGWTREQNTEQLKIIERA